jgi:FKBP-type peptidyl-prolyl cis-trans isomerase FkpA
VTNLYRKFAMTTLFSRAALIVFAFALGPVSDAQTAAASPTAAAKPPTTLVSVDRLVGDGPAVANGEPILVHYTGYLWDASKPDNKGAKFDSSENRPAPFGFIVGAGRVIKGWDEGLVGMKVGGQRTLIIPPDKAYGEKGAGAVIPPNSTLVFDVELMGIIGKTQQPKAAPSPFVPAKSGAQK